MGPQGCRRLPYAGRGTPIFSDAPLKMSNQLTRRDFAIRSAGFGLALGLAPAATLAGAEQASRSETSPVVADPYSLADPEFLPALKQFTAVAVSAEIVGKFRQSPS